jgi:TRAP-type C4-dicarboxylate transport system substrate-binding protein
MPLQDFTVNLGAWRALPDDVKAILEKTWKEFSAHQVKTIAADDIRVAEELKKKGIELVDWSLADRNRARDLAHGVWDEWAKKSPLAKQAIDSQRAYLRELKIVA